MSAPIEPDELAAHLAIEIERAQSVAEQHRHQHRQRRRCHAELNQRIRDEGDGRIEAYGYVWDADPESDMVIEEVPEIDEFLDE
jgi:hypothetical protein